jgi:hypothetical protein
MMTTRRTNSAARVAEIRAGLEVLWTPDGVHEIRTIHPSGRIDAGRARACNRIIARMKAARQAYRQAKQLGSLTISLGGRTFILGADVLRWMRRLRDEQGGGQQ